MLTRRQASPRAADGSAPAPARHATSRLPRLSAQSSPGTTAVTFVTDGIHSALEWARAVSGDKPVAGAGERNNAGGGVCGLSAKRGVLGVQGGDHGGCGVEPVL
jgi:hypothetical protein